MPDRVSRKQLEAFEAVLSDRDKSILNIIWEYRYLTTDQIKRLCFMGCATDRAALRTASRVLKKLREMKLISILDRQLGGVRAGSGSYIWYLAPAGGHLLRMMNSTIRAHKKQFEPSTYFLAHTLAVAECYVRITEICIDKKMKMTEVQNEPANWRSYNRCGKIASLKPDLFAVTACGGYEDHWFLEVDMATESAGKIIEKCHRYHEYYRTGLEQKQHGVFPLVVWIVPAEARKQNLMRHIQHEFAKHVRLFVVITFEELEHLLRQGAGESVGLKPC